MSTVFATDWSFVQSFRLALATSCTSAKGDGYCILVVHGWFFIEFFSRPVDKSPGSEALSCLITAAVNDNRGQNHSQGGSLNIYSLSNKWSKRRF